jgi:protein TonB
MSNDNTKSSLAFFLSILIHTLLAVAIVYTGLDMALPEGTVNSTEIDYVGGEIPLGTQTEDTTQVVDTVAEKKPEPPPPPPPPVKKIEASKPAEKPVALPPAAETVEVADTESEAAVEAAPEPTEPEPVLAQESPLEDDAPENTNSPTDSPVTQDEAPPATETSADSAEEAQENPIDGQSASNEAAYGTSSGVQSDSSLSPVPGNKNPEYPMWARLRRQEGVVVVNFEVLADGSVANTRIIQGSGFEALDAAAIKAHEKWRYRPGKTGTYTKNYNFRLTGQAEEAPTQLRRAK